MKDELNKADTNLKTELDEILDRLLWVPGLEQEELYKSMRKSLEQAILALLDAHVIEVVGPEELLRDDEQITAMRLRIANGRLKARNALKREQLNRHTKIMGGRDENT